LRFGLLNVGEEREDAIIEVREEKNLAGGEGVEK